jgi:hypothetical protein
MNSENNRDQSGESNAGAAMNDNSNALQKGIRKNASHPGDASNAAGMRRENQADQTDSNQDEDQARDDQ